MYNNKVAANRRYYNIIIVISFVLISITSVAFIANTGKLFSGADLLFHLKRISELKESFVNANFSPTYSFNQFHGSAVMTLYPYINLLPLIILSLFVRSRILSIYIWFALNILLSLILCFYCSLKFSKSILTSYVFSVIYSCSLMMLSYMFFDADYGVLTCLVSLPLVIFGILNLIYYNKWVELSIGIIAIIFSHVLSVFIVIGVILYFLLLNINKMNRHSIYSLLQLSIVVICITSIVWVPAIYLEINNIGNIASVGFPKLTGTSWAELLVNGLFNKINYSLTSFAIMGCIIPLLFYKRMNSIMKQMYLLSVLIVFICSTSFPWILFHYSVLQIIRMFQFSWRFYIIPQILLCYIFSYCITHFIKSNICMYILSIISILLTICIQFYGQNKIIKLNSRELTITKYYHKNHTRNKLFGIQHLHEGLTRPKYIVNSNKNFKTVNELDGNGTLYFKDYYPASAVKNLKYINNNYAITHHHLVFFKHDGYNKFLFNNKRKYSSLNIPIFYYKGEHLRIYLNGSKSKFKVKNGNIVIFNIKGGINRIFIRQEPNLFLILFEYVLFVIGLIYLIIYIIICKNNSEWIKHYFNIY